MIKTFDEISRMFIPEETQKAIMFGNEGPSEEISFEKKRVYFFGLDLHRFHDQIGEKGASHCSRTQNNIVVFHIA